MRTAILAAIVAVTGFSSAALAEGKKIGVSWAQFQEERWKIDEAAMKAAIEAAGNEYISADAQASAEKQLSDIDALIAQGVDALIINAWDKDAIGPAIEKAAAEGIPVVGYDRLIEDDRTFYLTFDNVGVGRIIAESVMKLAPEGQLRHHQGRPRRPEHRLPASGHGRSDRRRRGCGRHQDRRRSQLGRLEAGECSEEHGADPDRQQQRR
jgi:D-xylose transport system substrate-binding protein